LRSWTARSGACSTCSSRDGHAHTHTAHAHGQGRVAGCSSSCTCRESCCERSPGCPAGEPRAHTHPCVS
jgi:hypothetical protein